jgi:hypothetical protein
VFVYFSNYKTKEINIFLTSETTNNMTTEQQQIIERYFSKDGEQYHLNTGGIHIGFFEFTISRDTPVVLEIKVNHTVITMWKEVNQLHITIL